MTSSINATDLASVIQAAQGAAQRVEGNGVTPAVDGRNQVADPEGGTAISDREMFEQVLANAILTMGIDIVSRANRRAEKRRKEAATAMRG